MYGGCAEEGPYSEEKAAPANLYAAQKLEMEQRVLDICPDAVLLRAEWMYDYGATRPNYLMQVLHSPGPLAFSSRQFRGLTYLKEVAENLPAVVRLPGGVYNFGSETTQSMYQITADFLRLLGRDTPLADAPAHHNLWMDCGKARRYGVDFSPVSAALARCARDYRLIPE